MHGDENHFRWMPIADIIMWTIVIIVKINYKLIDCSINVPEIKFLGKLDVGTL